MKWPLYAAGGMEDKVASPVSTGGAGTCFEHVYAASWLALLLAGAEPPLFPGGKIHSVDVQVGHSWKTDDLLVRGELSSGVSFQLLAQAKLKCAPTVSDSDFSGFIVGAWDDFSNVARFNRATDRLLLLSSFQSPGLQRFRQLIEQARGTGNSAELACRLIRTGFLSKEVRAVQEAILSILAEVGVAPSVDDLWAFLRCCSVAISDLNVEGGNHEAQVVSLLRASCGETPAESLASASWAELQTLVSSGEAVAKSFSIGDLPRSLTRRHGLSRESDLRLLAEIKRSSQMVIDACSDSITGVALQRTQLEWEIADAIESGQLVLIEGSAGSGKSALAKRVFLRAAPDSFAIAFRAEEFAATSLRASPALKDLDFWKLLELSALFPRRIVLIESVERLLESALRDAFLDFIRQVIKDESWQVVLTCRSAWRASVEASFLAQIQVKKTVVEVKPLNDEELDYFAERIEHLQRPLSSPALRKLLRRPFLLKMAADMAWPTGVRLPASEHDFRDKVWAEVVRKDSDGRDGINIARGQTFSSIARNRAQSLRPYVRSEGSSAAVKALIDDGLLVRKAGSDSLVSPSHDLLEDWALARWLDEEFEETEGNLTELARRVDGFPALRKAFGRWLIDQIEQNPATAGNDLVSAVASPKLPQQLRDEMLTAVLRSSQAGEFVVKSKGQLLESEAFLLFRCLHLCRIAAMTPKSFQEGGVEHSLELEVPSGGAWFKLAELLSEKPDILCTESHLTQVAKFIDDWSSVITADVPYPEGVSAFAKVALSILAGVGPHKSHDDSVTLLAKFAAKVPLAQNDHLIHLLRQEIEANRGGSVGNLQSMVLSHVFGQRFARDLPDLVVECVIAYLDGGDERKATFGPPADIGEIFGLPNYLEMDSATASAVKGPFFNLLCFHPEKGLSLVIEVVNNASARYHELGGGQYVEPPEVVEIELPDGQAKPVFSNSRLWGMYRGSTVSPYPLQSALMALELWLLLLGDQKDERLPGFLEEIVRMTNNAALLALVASVSAAHSELAGSAVIAALSNRQFFGLDTERVVAESSLPMNGYIAPGDIDGVLAARERRDSRKRPHRTESLQELCRRLQYTSLRPKIHDLLDRFRREANAQSELEVEDAIWLKQINEMDLRTYRFLREEDGYNLFEPGDLPEDVENLLARPRETIAKQQVTMAMLAWGVAAWRHELKTDSEREKWPEMLDEALRVSLSVDDHFATGGAAYVCATIVRDRWDEISTSQQDSCIARIRTEILRSIDTKDDLLMRQIHTISGDRGAARTVVQLVRLRPDDEDLKRLLGTALTHPVEEVRLSAADEFLLENRNDLPALREVLQAIAMGCAHFVARQEQEKKKQWGERNSGVDLLVEALLYTRQILNSGRSDGSFLSKLIFDDAPGLFPGVVANWLSHSPGLPESKKYFTRNVIRLAACIAGDDKFDRYGEHITGFYNSLARYALAVDASQGVALLKPLSDLVGPRSREVARFLTTLQVEACSLEAFDQFWRVREPFVERVLMLPDKELHGRSVRHRDLLRHLYLDLATQDDSGARLVQSRETELRSLYVGLSSCPDSTEFYLLYLVRFGEQSLPRAFVDIAHKLGADKVQPHLTPIAVKILEQLLSPRVFAQPYEMKRYHEIRNAVIFLLDALVDAGSASAFRMRDDFVTPLPPDEIRSS